MPCKRPRTDLGLNNKLIVVSGGGFGIGADVTLLVVDGGYVHLDRALT